MPYFHNSGKVLQDDPDMKMPELVKTWNLQQEHQLVQNLTVHFRILISLTNREALTSDCFGAASLTGLNLEGNGMPTLD